MSLKKSTYTMSLTAAVALALTALAPPATAAAGSDSLSRARAATARYHRVDVARDVHYQLLTDAAGIACIDKPGEGGMGIHYVNSALVGDPTVNAATPELLVYEPKVDGKLRLVAVEYVVLQSAWEGARNTAPPSLFGRTFELVRSPNRYGLPPFYELHAWIWKHNPSGMFDDWNPRVSCAAA